MGIGAVCMTIPALIMDVFLPEVNVFSSLASNYSVMVPVLLGGVFITLMYQGAVVAVTAHTHAVSVGILHQILVYVFISFM